MASKSGDMSKTETSIFDAIAKNDFAEFKSLLAQHKGSVDFFDENGMTALQHAAYKGNKDMVQLLLDRVSEIGVKYAIITITRLFTY